MSQPQHRHTNLLAREKSPYLLQHQHNPVAWRAWNAESLAEARATNTPIFLSIGYSACHWCHVMERESFEDAAIAEIVNAHFIPIKVDREERPDVDDLYMTAVQMMTGSGGWPLNIFLTPDGRPFYGGTYFPPEDRGGRVGFGNLVAQLGDAWANRRAEIEEVADTITVDLKKAVRQSPGESDASGPMNPHSLLKAAVTEMQGRFDARNGGFGRAPKFPPHHALRLLVAAIRHGELEHAPAILTRTLDRMALGGIYDHVGGGFHRYSTDAVWLLPHFEKMLYDNALLARVYADAFLLTGRPAYARVARETCDWVLREMVDPSTGGFYSALDADSEGEEGKFYVWTVAELTAILGSETAEAFGALYNFDPAGNYREEAGGHRSGANIPYLSIGETDIELPDSMPDAHERARVLLRIARGRRVRPGIDDKILASWNGLMIGALAFCGAALERADYIEAATRAADFCLTALMPDGNLLRRYAGGEAAIPGYLDDYAFLADGLLELYAANEEPRFRDAAVQLAEQMIAGFADPENGGFYFTADSHEALLARGKDLFDGALPSANGVATRLIARLGTLPDGERFGDAARSLLRRYRGVLQRAPQGTHSLIEAAMIAFPADGEDDDALVRWSNVHSAGLSLTPGETGAASFTLSIAPGYYVASYKPGETDSGATVATLSSDLPAAVGPIRFPAAKEVGGEHLYLETAEFIVPVVAAEDAAPGVYRLSLALRCALCGMGRCLPVETHTSSVLVTIRG